MTTLHYFILWHPIGASVLAALWLLSGLGCLTAGWWLWRITM